MHKRKFLIILSWILLRDVLAVVAFAVFLALKNATPPGWYIYAIWVFLIIPIGSWIRERIVPRYCEDHFAGTSRRFRVVWHLIWWGIFIGLGIVILSGNLSPDRFNRLDRNRDGKVSIDELTRFMGKDSREDMINMMERYDRDKDGYLSKQEYEDAFNLVAGGPSGR